MAIPWTNTCWGCCETGRGSRTSWSTANSSNLFGRTKTTDAHTRTWSHKICTQSGVDGSRPPCPARCMWGAGMALLVWAQRLSRPAAFPVAGAACDDTTVLTHTHIPPVARNNACPSITGASGDVTFSRSSHDMTSNNAALRYGAI